MGSRVTGVASRHGRCDARQDRGDRCRSKASTASRCAVPPPGSASAPSASRSRSSAPGADEYPEHDHAEDGIGGKMFAKRPQQLGQEEVYVALRGSGTLVVDGEEYPIDPDTSSAWAPASRARSSPAPMASACSPSAQRRARLTTAAARCRRLTRPDARPKGALQWLPPEAKNLEATSRSGDQESAVADYELRRFRAAEVRIRPNPSDGRTRAGIADLDQSTPRVGTVVPQSRAEINGSRR